MSSGHRPVILARAARSASARLPGGVRIQLATCFGAGAGGLAGQVVAWRSWAVAAHGAQAAAVAAGADLLVQPSGAVAAFFPPGVQVGQVRVQEAGLRGPGAAGQLAGTSGGGVAAHGLAVQLQDAADLGQGQPAGQRGVGLIVPGAGPQHERPLGCGRGWRVRR